jgi:Protein of unknown function (DUF2946)
MIAWLVPLAVLSNILASALYVAPSSAKAAKAVDEVLGTLVICHGAGGAADPSDGNSPSTSEHCKLCPLLAAFVLVATLAPVLVTFPTPAAFSPRPGLARTLADHLSLGGIYSRGPPLSA